MANRPFSGLTERDRRYIEKLCRSKRAGGIAPLYWMGWFLVVGAGLGVVLSLAQLIAVLQGALTPPMRGTEFYLGRIGNGILWFACGCFMLNLSRCHRIIRGLAREPSPTADANGIRATQASPTRKGLVQP